MSWYRFVASAVIFSAALGCQAQQSLHAGANGPAGEPAAVQRLQKPESDNVKPVLYKSLLDMAPEHTGGPDTSRVAARIRATVNTVPILDEEVRESCYQYLIQASRLPEPERSRVQKEIFEQTLQQLIEREVVLQDVLSKFTKGGQQQLAKLKEAANKEFDRQVRAIKAQPQLNIKTDEDFKEFLKAQGLSLEGMRRQKEREFIFMEYIRYRVSSALDHNTGHAQIVDYYRQHPEEFQMVDSVQWQDIFIDAGKHPNREAARQFAEQIANRIRKGDDVAQLAGKYDDGVSRFRNGEGDGKRHGEIKPPEAEPILFRMRNGEVAPILELGNGFHIIYLIKRDQAGQMPLDEKTQTQIKDKLRNDIFKREAKRIVEDLKRNCVIQIASGAQ